METWKSMLQRIGISSIRKIRSISWQTMVWFSRAIKATLVIPKLIAFLTRKIHAAVCVIEPWSIVLVSVGVTAGIIGILGDMENRISDREFRSWQTVNSFEALVSQNEGSTAHRQLPGRDLRQALEFLNQESTGFLCLTRSEEQPQPWFSLIWYARFFTGDDDRRCIIPTSKTKALLSGLKASRVILPNLELPNAVLDRADFSASDLSHSNLSGGSLYMAKFQNGTFVESNFKNSCLFVADFTGASLVGADFSGAYLVGVNFSNTNLKNAKFSRAYIVDNYVVDEMFKHFEKTDEPNNLQEDGLITLLIELSKNVSFYITKGIVEKLSTFAKKCGHLLPPKLEHFSSQVAVGLFSIAGSNEIRKALKGIDFKNAKGLKSEQFSDIACPYPRIRIKDANRYEPKNLPEDILIEKECN